MNDIKIVTVDENNISEYGFYCSKNPKYEGYQLKFDWLKQRFTEGLKIKLLQSNTEGTIGFIEYIASEYAWRAVDASGYLVIHCIYIYSKKDRKKGYGSLLVNDCIEDAKKEKKNGVAVVTSDGPMMAEKRLFLKNGFGVVDKAERFELLVKQLKEGTLPKFKNWEKELSKYKGLNLIYANQCPYHKKAVSAICDTAEEKGLQVKVFEIKDAKDAQNAPSIYGVFCLVHDGKLLADHYISKTRFLNIFNKEL
ncbi:MAG: YoaP domain-containing protein [Candidatus Wukongarchaeota archaeon]|nr:GNAT family N-acetyltransferase [Candidatus Wukongarchaeota archaeon]